MLMTSVGLVGGADEAQAALSDPFPNGIVTIDGHGYGPGVGMGQWGAFGYAAVSHESYQWIVSHFYGGTTLATTGSRQVGVGIIENVGVPVGVTSAWRFRFGGIVFPGHTVVRAVLSSATSTWRLASASSCTASSWTVVKTGLTAPQAVPISQKADAPTTEILTLCRADGVEEPMRGIVKAVDFQGGMRTVNVLPLDEYVADVVPSESSSGWGMVGGAGPQGEQWGFQSLEAQAVAARTYTLAYEAAGGWPGGSSSYADICDNDFCQTYPGTVNEAAVSTHAAEATSGQYLTLKGAPATTQYSASTGGYTITSQYPAVADAGDQVCISSNYWTCNPDHYWSTTTKVTTVEADFPTIGTLQSITVVTRTGCTCSWGGRALSVRISGSKASVTVSGNDFQARFGLLSNWFLIAHPTTSAVWGAGPAATAPAVQRTAAGTVLGTGTGPLPSDGRPAFAWAAGSRG